MINGVWDGLKWSNVTKRRFLLTVYDDDIKMFDDQDESVSYLYTILNSMLLAFSKNKQIQ